LAPDDDYDDDDNESITVDGMSGRKTEILEESLPSATFSTTEHA
jgi:hypothetical protein